LCHPWISIFTGMTEVRTARQSRGVCGFRSASLRAGSVSVAPAQELGLLVVTFAFVYYAEEPGGARGSYDNDVALGVVDLDGDAEVVSWFVFVGYLEGDLDGGLLLAIAVAP
jgi:hypothetical protein